MEDTMEPTYNQDAFEREKASTPNDAYVLVEGWCYSKAAWIYHIVRASDGFLDDFMSYYDRGYALAVCQLHNSRAIKDERLSALEDRVTQLEKSADI